MAGAPGKARPKNGKKVAGTTLLPWHRKILPLVAQGYGHKAIAARTGIPIPTLRYALRSPAVIQAADKLREASLKRWGTQIGDQLMRDAPKNLAFLEAVRDNQLDGRTAEVRDSVTAAIRLMDSTMPRKTASTQHLSGQIGVGVAMLSHEEALDITHLAKEAGIELPALPAPEDA